MKANYSNLLISLDVPVCRKTFKKCTLYARFSITNCVFLNCTIDLTLKAKSEIYNNKFINCTFRLVEAPSNTFSYNQFYKCVFCTNSIENIVNKKTKYRKSYLKDSIIQDCDFYKCFVTDCSCNTTREEMSINMINTKIEAIHVKDSYLGYIPMVCPEEGSFIGFKKAKNFTKNEEVIIKLEILEDSKRLSQGQERICRCNKARVLEITGIKTGKEYTKAFSALDWNHEYVVGDIIECSDFDDNRWHLGRKGIYFFLNRKEAEYQDIK